MVMTAAKTKSFYATGDAVALIAKPGQRLLVIDAGIDAKAGPWVAVREDRPGVQGMSQRRFVVKPGELKAWSDAARQAALAARRAGGGHAVGSLPSDNKFKPGDKVRVDGTAINNTFSGNAEMEIVNPHANRDQVTHTTGKREYNGAYHHIPTATVKNPRNGKVHEVYHHILSKPKGGK